ncbi:MAG: hypothetical protein ACF787_04370, partial [Rhodopirellula sp. JB053]
GTRCDDARVCACRFVNVFPQRGCGEEEGDKQDCRGLVRIHGDETLPVCKGSGSVKRTRRSLADISHEGC